MNSFSTVPPGFRFHPTDEELVDYYLRKKIASRRIDLDIIKDVDLYKIEPWDLQEICGIGAEEQNEWYFFSHKDKKYPTGTRTNRATSAGFWKATGRDKAIYSKHELVGMRKTLVFYKGRAPHGQKSDWIMHEYRLETDENGTPQEEGWVVCRVFKKRIATVQKMNEQDESSCWYDDQVSFIQQNSDSNLPYNNLMPYTCKKELDLPYNQVSHQNYLLQSTTNFGSNSMAPYGADINNATTMQTSPQDEYMQLTQDQNLCHMYEQRLDQVTDWRALDKFVASQLSHEDDSKENNYSTNCDMNLLLRLNKEENDPASSSSCQIDMWK